MSLRIHSWTKKGLLSAWVAAGWAFILLLAGGGCTPTAVASGEPLDAFTAHLDARVPQWMAQYDIPGVSMALVRDGELVWTGAYGYADVAQQRPMTADTICRAESISKSVTAWGVMKLVAQGRVDLDAPVQAYLDDYMLPDSPYDAGAMTVRQLLSNSGGMPLGTIGPAAEYAPQDAMPSAQEYLAQEGKSVQAPGAGFIYSNVGYNMLALLVESVTGRDFTAYMADEVLAPLGMDGATYGWNESIAPLIANGYELDGTPVPPYVYPLSASGGLLADVEEIARFVAAEMGENRVLPPESVRALHTPQVAIPGLFGLVADSYGFGHFIETLPNGETAVWHGGQGHGWMTHFHAVPARGDGIVILTNSQRSWPFMAHVLRDWARWSGVESVKFGQITTATTVLQILVGAVGLAALWQAFRLVRGLRRGVRRFAPLAPQARPARLIQAAAAIGVVGVLAWRSAQPYLFETSIFPATAGWAALALLALALVAFASALAPRIGGAGNG